MEFTDDLTMLPLPIDHPTALSSHHTLSVGSCSANVYVEVPSVPHSVSPPIRPSNMGALSMETKRISKEIAKAVAMMVSAYKTSRNNLAAVGMDMIPNLSKMLNQSRP